MNWQKKLRYIPLCNFKFRSMFEKQNLCFFSFKRLLPSKNRDNTCFPNDTSLQLHEECTYMINVNVCRHFLILRLKHLYKSWTTRCLASTLPSFFIVLSKNLKNLRSFLYKNEKDNDVMKLLWKNTIKLPFER